LVTQRSVCNKFLFNVLYKLFRLIYVGYWFYFSPLIFSLFQFFLPMYVIVRDGKLPEATPED